MNSYSCIFGQPHPEGILSHLLSCSSFILMANAINCLVERRNREINKHLIRNLFDTNNHNNWSAQIPLVQLLVNSQHHSITKFAPWQLMFGTNIDPRKPPLTLLESLKAHKASTTTLTLIDGLAAKTHSLLAKWEEAEKNEQAYIDLLTSRVPDPPEFKEGDLVLRIVENPRRLHGRWRGPLKSLKPSQTQLRLRS
ncbi:hypothetical protein GEMRC1_009755 [Eukaryota sp. GEM-RC1]